MDALDLIKFGLQGLKEWDHKLIYNKKLTMVNVQEKEKDMCFLINLEPKKNNAFVVYAESGGDVLNILAEYTKEEIEKGYEINRLGLDYYVFKVFKENYTISIEINVFRAATDSHVKEYAEKYFREKTDLKEINLKDELTHYKKIDNSTFQ